MKPQIMKTSIMCNPMTPGNRSGLADVMTLKSRQQTMWASGDFAVIGTTLQIVGEELCEAMDLRSGQRVLDVAAGNGNAALAAARRWCDVTASDYVPALLDRARERALGERLPLKIEVADAEALPFPDESFDAVMSTFGAMFTPDHQKPAKEMLRVCREGGKICLAAVRTRAPLRRPSERAGDRARVIPQEVVWISVTDEGVGIRREDMPKLFQEFSQVDSSASRRAQGTGLGLALCKKFVEMHGGTIGADSVYGKGTALWFLLPADGPVRRTA